MCIFGFLTSSWGPLSWQCPLCHTFIPHWDCRFSIILLPPPCDTSEGRAPSQERCCARQNCSEVHHFSAEQPKSILFSLSPCPADSYGNIEPDLEPVWALAVAGSSSIMWEKSTETLGYFLAQVKTVKQWVSGAAESTALRGVTPRSQGDSSHQQLHLCTNTLCKFCWGNRPYLGLQERLLQVLQF